MPPVEGQVQDSCIRRLESDAALLQKTGLRAPEVGQRQGTDESFNKAEWSMASGLLIDSCLLTCKRFNATIFSSPIDGSRK
jgi:hypothetical protein